jgi:hypothetical protein
MYSRVQGVVQRRPAGSSRHDARWAILMGNCRRIRGGIGNSDRQRAAAASLINSQVRNLRGTWMTRWIHALSARVDRSAARMHNISYYVLRSVELERC